MIYSKYMVNIIPDNKLILTVSELTRNIKSILTRNFYNIWIRGEISNYRLATSGHIYFSLKDVNAVLKAVLFKGYQNGIKFNLEDGLKVIVHGNLDLFEKRGEYQIIVDFMEPEGKGALQLAFEQLKQKLKDDGLFEDTHKRPIPPFPETIGVITSATGAALRDILNVTKRRYSNIHIVIYPSLVQGEEAAKSIVEAIRKANGRKETDVIILGRGGGSIEDLWPFNEEIVARAIYESEIPIISAVGHEIDFTISDFVADLRAPTPSAAAELVVQNKEELIKWFQDKYKRMVHTIDRILDFKKDKLSHYSFDKLLWYFESILNQKSLTLDDVTKNLSTSMDLLINKCNGKFETLAGALNALSPLKTISRGFAIIEKVPENSPIFSIKQVKINNNIKTRLKDGYFISNVNNVFKEKNNNLGDSTR